MLINLVQGFKAYFKIFSSRMVLSCSKTFPFFHLIILVILLEKHIRSKIREYLKPFKFFLGAIGRFPYTVVDPKKKDILQEIKKASCAPIMEMGVIQEQVIDDDDEGTLYTIESKTNHPLSK